MKKLLLLLTALVLLACNNDDDSWTAMDNTQHTPPTGLKRPDVILNDIAKGTFNNGVLQSVYKETYTNLNYTWLFTTDELGERIKSMIYEHSCETTSFTYFYNTSNLIDSIVSVRYSPCTEVELKWVHHYNYDDGLLISITGKSYLTSDNATNKLMMVGENYFSYHPDGNVAEIYFDLRSPGVIFKGYSKFVYEYDEHNNVASVTRKEFGNDTYDQKYTYEYDDNINPFRGIYVASNHWVTMPSLDYEAYIGPDFLSGNCVKSVKEEYVNNPSNTQFTYFQSGIENGRVNLLSTAPGNTQSKQVYINYQ